MPASSLCARLLAFAKIKESGLQLVGCRPLFAYYVWCILPPLFLWVSFLIPVIKCAAGTLIFNFQFSIFNSQLSPTFVRRHCGSPRNYLHGCCYPSGRNHRSRNYCGCYCYRLSRNCSKSVWCYCHGCRSPMNGCCLCYCPRRIPYSCCWNYCEECSPRSPCGCRCGCSHLKRCPCPKRWMYPCQQWGDR